MHNKDYKTICLAAIPLIRKVGKFIYTQRGKVKQDQIEIKGLNSLVSYVDKEAELMLVEGLGKIVPEASFITEENTVKQEKSNIVWIIDPLDGTSNYLHNIPHYSISVALMVEGSLKVGLVLAVSSNELFYAWENGAAFCNDEQINVSKTQKVKDALIATGFPYKVKDVAPLIRTLGHFMRYARGIRRFGSAALDLSYVACGRFDCYYETTLNSWDVAAGALIVRQAGGHVSNFSGTDEFLFKGEIIASTSAIHESVKKIIQQNFY